MSDLNINNITDRTGDSGPVIAGISTVTSTGAFTVPVGPTEYRGGRGRGIFSNGRNNPNYYSTMGYVEIATTGNTSDFGDTSKAINGGSGNVSNSTRGLVAGGYEGSPGANVSHIDYYIFSSSGGASDFGDLLEISNTHGGLSNNSRGIYGGYYPSYSGILSYVTIASTGNATNFGSLLAREQATTGVNSPTRGIHIGITVSPVMDGSGSIVQRTEYVTIDSKGNSEEFGELTVKRSGQGGCSSSTRGLTMGGLNPSILGVIDYCTIATLGDFIDFGDLTTSRRSGASCSSSTRGLYGGGTTPTNLNTIDYVTIASTGNATDFGDLSYVARGINANSDVHGGLG